MRTGRTAHVAIDGATFASFVGHHTEYRAAGVPSRTRKYINGTRLDDPSHVRMLRRWKAGMTVTTEAARALLADYELSLADYIEWCDERTIMPTLHGEID